MIRIEPSEYHLGATVRGVDVSKPLTPDIFGKILAAIGQYGLLRFPEQTLTPEQHRDFASMFGHTPAIRGRLAIFTIPGVPEINILSNIKENGKNIGAMDAGVIWHTDMVHNETPGFANVLYALKVPHRDGRVLGGTEFYNLQKAFEDLPSDIKNRLENRRGVYSGENYNSIERTPFPEYGTNSHRNHKKAPVFHPVIMTHPVSAKKLLYCDPGHIDYIEGLPIGECDEMLQYLLTHIMQPMYHCVYEWTEGDVMMWDNLRTLHHAVLDFGPNEHRLIWRCQIEGDKVFDPVFVRTSLDQIRPPET